MEIGLHERQLAHGDVRIGIRGRICNRRPRISKDGYVAKVAEIEKSSRNIGKGTNPCSTESA